MLLIIGAVIVFASVLGGYVLHGGNLMVLWQPTEILIIFGAAIGSFIIANPVHTLKEVVGGCLRLLTGSSYNKAFYVDLLSLLWAPVSVLSDRTTARAPLSWAKRGRFSPK